MLSTAETSRSTPRRGNRAKQLLEIAKTWDTLAVERPEWVQQHLELALGEHQDEDALTGRGSLLVSEGDPDSLCAARPRSTARRRPNP